MYGPPTGPHHGQPQDPWHDPRQDPPLDGYGVGEPDEYPDPWAHADPVAYQSGHGYGTESYPERPYAQEPYRPQSYGRPPAQVWGPPAPFRKRRGPGGLIAAIVVLAVVLCGGAGVAVYAATRSGRPAAAGGAPPAALPTGVPNDATTAKSGDCLVNQGSTEAPRLRKVTCAPGAFQVLKRIDATSDVARCDGVPGYTHNYFYKTSTDATSFVLCMRQL